MLLGWLTSIHPDIIAMRTMSRHVSRREWTSSRLPLQDIQVDSRQRSYMIRPMQMNHLGHRPSSIHNHLLQDPLSNMRLHDRPHSQSMESLVIRLEYRHLVILNENPLLESRRLLMPVSIMNRV